MTIQEALAYKPAGMFMFDQTFFTFAENYIQNRSNPLPERRKLVDLCDEAYGYEPDHTGMSDEEIVEEYALQMDELTSWSE